jgi:hypothetical protein
MTWQVITPAQEEGLMMTPFGVGAPAKEKANAQPN